MHILFLSIWNINANIFNQSLKGLCLVNMLQFNKVHMVLEAGLLDMALSLASTSHVHFYHQFKHNLTHQHHHHYYVCDDHKSCHHHHYHNLLLLSFNVKKFLSLSENYQSWQKILCCGRFLQINQSQKVLLHLGWKQNSPSKNDNLWVGNSTGTVGCMRWYCKMKLNCQGCKNNILFKYWSIFWRHNLVHADRFARCYSSQSQWIIRDFSIMLPGTILDH